MPISTRLCLDLLRGGALPLSRCSPGALRELRTPLAAGLLREDRRGAGKVLQVLDPEGFRAWLVARFPAILGAAAGAGPRSSNLALNRNTKQGVQGLDACFVHARAHRVPETLAGPDREAMASLVDCTARWGGATLLLDLPAGGAPATGRRLPEGMTVMTLENRETFHHSEALQAHADIFLLAETGGRMRKAYVQWLAAQPGLRIRHFGDFDPVGLQEFVRMRAAMPGRVELYLPEDLEDRIQVFHNRGLLDSEASRSVLAGLARGLDPALDRVLELVAIHGPLEQEAFLIQGTGGAVPVGPPTLH